MSPYKPPSFQAPIELDLSRNEGRSSINALDLDSGAFSKLTSKYPDASRVARAAASRHSVDEQRVLVTAGGDDALFRCFLRTKSSILATTPSFEMISSYASQLGRELVEVSWFDGEFPIDEFLARESELAVIVSPNNPTGAVIDEAVLHSVASNFPLVVLDAAYIEFADDDLTAVALAMDNVVVIRTLSKAFGLAGLRVGYLVGPIDVVSELRGFGSPYSVSALSAEIGGEALADGVRRVDDYVAKVVTNRDRLIDSLDRLGASPLPSQANFVLATKVDPEWVVPAAASLGVALRGFPGREGLDGCVRITVPGDPDDMDRLDATLRAVLSPQALLFDMDGVLADVSGSYRKAIRSTAAAFGVSVAKSQVAEAKAAGRASDDWKLTQELMAQAGVHASYEEVRDRFEAIYQGDGVAPGLKQRERLLVDPELLESWAARMPLGVVTARPRRDAEEFLQRFGVRKFFKTLVAREDAPSKPSPAPVRLAMERLGVAHAWMIGDTRDDVEAARAAGVVPIAVVAAGTDAGPLRSAARILNSVDEIKEVLDVTKG